jgi:hypothetical protein
LEQESHETLQVGVEPERIGAVSPLGDVARKDRYEEDSDDEADQDAVPTQRDECSTEGHFDDARRKYDDVVVEREPVRNLCLEVDSLAREVGNTSDQQDATEHPTCDRLHATVVCAELLEFDKVHGGTLPIHGDKQHPDTAGYICQKAHRLSFYQQ